MFKWNIEKVMMLMGYRKIMTNVPPIPHFLDWQGEKCPTNALGARKGMLGNNIDWAINLMGRF